MYQLYIPQQRNDSNVAFFKMTELSGLKLWNKNKPLFLKKHNKLYVRSMSTSSTPHC